MQNRKLNLYLGLLVSIPEILLGSFAAHAQAEQSTNFTSPSGIAERCTVLAKIPSGDYTKKDLEKESLFCSINFYDTAAASSPVAMCPKYLSTSAAIMLYDLLDPKYNPQNKTAVAYELQHCGVSPKRILKKVAKFKPTMNQSNTSALFSAASPLYYHLSRYLDTQVHTPVAVYRSIDKDQLSLRVIEPAFDRNLIPHAMNHAAWTHLREAVASPSTYNAKAETFTDDLTQVFGTLVKDTGERYGEEFNGLDLANGYPSYETFADTVAFRALKSEKPIAEAIADAITSAQAEPAMNQVLTSKIHATQVAFWMRDVTEIALLDYIMSQQDRIGNIDYEWKWLYQEAKPDGSGIEMKSMDVEKSFSDYARAKIGSIPVPALIANKKPILIQRTILGDNDAGGKVRYSNVAKREGWLSQFRHLNRKTYKRLMDLNTDLQGKGAVYQYLVQNFQTTNFKIQPAEINQIVVNTKLAADILKAQCLSGNLKFDLSPKDFYLTDGQLDGPLNPAAVNCLNPQVGLK